MQSPDEAARAKSNRFVVPVAHFDRIGRLTTGWVYDPRSGSDPTSFVLKLDEIVVNAKANLARPDVMRAGISPHPLVGFSIDLSEAFARWRLAKAPGTAPKAISLVIGEQTILQEHLPDLSEVEGRLQTADSDKISGFVTGKAIETLDIEIELFVDGLLMTTVTADRLDTTADHAVKWFHLLTPTPPAFNRDYVVDARIMFSGRPLDNGSQIVAGKTNIQIPRYVTSILAADKNPTVSIVIPVFNAPDQLRACLEAIARETTRPARLILIDDASTDTRINDILRPFASSPTAIVHRHPDNLGYTASINEGLQLAGSDDVVLLNSDTIVPPRWLENLRFAAYSDDAIATVSPLSDNAGAFSAPEAEIRNDLPPATTTRDLARHVSQDSAALLPEVPTSSGFCMYIKRACIDDIGIFDAQTFPRGYGEENDFCLRAMRAGWRHVIDDRTFVIHHRSTSFGDQQRGFLSLTGRTKLDQRYPEYPPLLRAFYTGWDLAISRHHVRRAFERVKGDHTARPRVLTIISSQTGGTPLTNIDLARGLSDSFEAFLLHSDKATLSLSVLSDGEFRLVAKKTLANPIQLARHFSSAYNAAFAEWLVEYSIELVHVRHIARHGLGLTAVCQQLEIPVLFSFHDFYTVCPTVKLLDQSLKFCGGTCTQGPGPCSAELWPVAEVPELKHSWVRIWREQTSAMLQEVDAFVTTSTSTRDIVCQNFPDLAKRPFSVIPHGRDFSRFARSAIVPRADRALRLLAPGNLSEAKGAQVLAELKILDTENLLEIHTLGQTAALLDDLSMVHHGPYQREDFIGIAEEIRPHFGLILSIWPETHCHALTELWAAGIPVIGFDLGAVGERIRRYGGGITISALTARAVYDSIISVAKDKSRYHKMLAAVINWQTDVAVKQTAADMSAAYRDLYWATINRRAPFLLLREGEQVS